MFPIVKMQIQIATISGHLSDRSDPDNRDMGVYSRDYRTGTLLFWKTKCQQLSPISTYFSGFFFKSMDFQLFKYPPRTTFGTPLGCIQNAFITAKNTITVLIG